MMRIVFSFPIATTAYQQHSPYISTENSFFTRIGERIPLLFNRSVFTNCFTELLSENI